MAEDALDAALDLIGREYSLSRAEVRERLLARPAKTARRALPPAPVEPAAPAEGEPCRAQPCLLRLWRRELIERVFVSLDARSLARLLRVSRWPLENSAATLRRLTALIGLDEAAARRSTRHFETQMRLRLVRTREILFREEFDPGWQTRWPAMPGVVEQGFTARTVTHDGVQCGEIVHSENIAFQGLKRVFATPGLRPSVVSVKMCAPEGLEEGKAAGYFILEGAPEERSVFCYFRCYSQEEVDEDEVNEFEVGELSLNLVSDRDDDRNEDGEPDTIELVRHATPGRWYDVRFEIDWEAQRMNVTLDGRVSLRGLPFYSNVTGEPGPTGVREIQLHNYYTAAPGRWADIKFHG